MSFRSLAGEHVITNKMTKDIVLAQMQSIVLRPNFAPSTNTRPLKKEDVYVLHPLYKTFGRLIYQHEKEGGVVSFPNHPFPKLFHARHIILLSVHIDSSALYRS